MLETWPVKLPTFATTQVKAQENKLLGQSRSSTKVRFYRNNIVHIKLLQSEAVHFSFGHSRWHTTSISRKILFMVKLVQVPGIWRIAVKPKRLLQPTHD